MTRIYDDLINAIAQSATVKSAIIRTELAVGLIHFTQENNQTDTQGKSNLKSVYHSAGYDCLTKQDKHYKRVNHKVNITAKLFDKLTSSVVNGWIEEMTEASQMLAKITLELEVYKFEAWDDVAELIGVESNRTRKARTPNPVTTTKPEPEQEDPQDKDEVTTVELDLDALQATLMQAYGDEMLREFCVKMLEAIDIRETATLLKAA